MTWVKMHPADDKELGRIVERLRARGLNNGAGREFVCTEDGDIRIKAQYSEALRQAIAEARAGKKSDD